MTDRLQPYPAMRDSGVEWLGQVPAHWRVLPNRAIFAEVKESGHSDEEMLSVTISNGVIRQDELLADSSKKDQSRIDRSMYKLVQPEEIVYNKMRAWQGAFGVSEYRGIVSPAYIVQRPLSSIYAQYAHYLFRMPAFAKEVERCSYGITSDMWSLRPEDFKTISVCAPPLPEQAAIVRFLDHADRRIRLYISTKEKLIALLEEQKQAVIQQAVMGRIDVCTGGPYTTYKPSGAEWLGDVPAHWRVLPNRAVFTEVKELGHSDEQMLSVTISSGIIRQNELLEDSSKKDQSRVDKSAYKLIQPGEIAYNKMRAWQGAIGVSEQKGIVSPAYIVQRPLDLADAAYMHRLFRTPAFAKEAERRSYGIASDMWSLRPEDFKTIRVCIPPPPEQTSIVRYLDKIAVTVDNAIARARREIDLLREYRTRLIADVVTGKVEVRSAVAELPESKPIVDDGRLDAIQDEAEFPIAEGSIVQEASR